MTITHSVMTSKQEPAKDDRLVVRIDKETKEAFMYKVDIEGKNASEVIIGWIRDYLAKELRTPDLLQISTELETLKKKVAYLEDEAQKKSAA